MKQHPFLAFFRSIAGKVAGVLVLCVAVLLATNWLLNSFVFLAHYEGEQKELLVASYTELDDAPRSQRTLAGLLDGYAAQHGMQALLWSSRQVLYTSLRQPAAGPFLPAPVEAENGTYTLSNRTPPLAEGGNWVMLTGRTHDGLNVMLWLPLSDVKEGTAITNRFLLWSGLITLLLGGVAVVLLARSFTRPVRQLSAMAARMAQLDFSDRYTGDGRDELAELGRSLNTVSATLEENLSELKTANLRLRGDMERQSRQHEARTRFIRNVSHELKTPLALIQSYAEGLHENAADDPAARAYYCEVIEDEAQKLTQMLAKLTMLMQLESGKADLAIERFDLRDLLARLLARYEPLFIQRGIPTPALPDTPCAAWGDAALIENVATNYLTNALNHVADGGTIRVWWEDTPRGTVAVRVFNTGAPIPEEDLPHLWESFYKVDKAHTRAYGGTGIGLSVVAAIMTAHGMPYTVENTEDGVCFSFELAKK